MRVATRLGPGLCLVLSVSAGCFTFSSYQSARIVDRGKPRVTYSISRNNFIERDQIDAGWTTLEALGRYPVKARLVDAGARISILRSDEGGIGSVVGGDLKAGVIRDHLAVALPASVLLGDFSFTTFQLQPGLIASVPIGDRIEGNAAARTYIFMAETEDGPVYAYNLGLALHPRGSRWAIRPEVGWLTLRGSGDRFVQFGIGVEGPARPHRPEKSWDAPVGKGLFDTIRERRARAAAQGIAVPGSDSWRHLAAPILDGRGRRIGHSRFAYRFVADSGDGARGGSPIRARGDSLMAARAGSASWEWRLVLANEEGSPFGGKVEVVLLDSEGGIVVVADAVDTGMIARNETRSFAARSAIDREALPRATSATWRFPGDGRESAIRPGDVRADRGD